MVRTSGGLAALGGRSQVRSPTARLRRSLTIEVAAVFMVILLAPALHAEVSSSLDDRLAAVRSAFLQNDAAALARQFPARDRVFIALPAFQTEGFVGPGPLHALLDRFAAEAQALAFEVTRPDIAAADRTGLCTYVKARWTFRELSSGLTRSEELYLTLRRMPEGGEWRIVELKAAR